MTEITIKPANPVKMARQAGLLYLLLVPLGVFGIMYIPDFLIVSQDANATINNIINNETMYRLSVLSALAIQVTQLFVVFALYRVLKPVNRTIGLFMVAFILIAMPIAMLNELTHIAVLGLVKNTEFLTWFSSDQLNFMVMFLLNLHNDGIMIAHVFWGLWLLPMGILVYRSGFIPRVFGLLLFVGCFGYLADMFIWLLLPEYNIVVSEFTFIGELLLPLWLVFKGVDIDKWSEKERMSANH